MSSLKYNTTPYIFSGGNAVLDRFTLLAAVAGFPVPPPDIKRVEINVPVGQTLDLSFAGESSGCIPASTNIRVIDNLLGSTTQKYVIENSESDFVRIDIKNQLSLSTSVINKPITVLLIF